MGKRIAVGQVNEVGEVLWHFPVMVTVEGGTLAMRFAGTTNVHTVALDQITSMGIEDAPTAPPAEPTAGTEAGEQS